MIIYFTCFIAYLVPNHANLVYNAIVRHKLLHNAVVLNVLGSCQGLYKAEFMSPREAACRQGL